MHMTHGNKLSGFKRKVSRELDDFNPNLDAVQKFRKKQRNCAKRGGKENTDPRAKCAVVPVQIKTRARYTNAKKLKLLDIFDEMSQSFIWMSVN